MRNTIGTLLAFALVALGCTAENPSAADGSAATPDLAQSATTADLTMPATAPDFSVGVCQVDTQCAMPTPRCDATTGKCVVCLPQNDNCGSGKHCTASNGTYACLTGCLSLSDCPTPGAGSLYACCNNLCIDTGTDVKNCGSCGSPCAAPSNGSPVCTAGVCRIAGCNAGYADCNHSYLDGCEAQTASDPNNCGGCGVSCPGTVANGSAVCAQGTCSITCSANFGNCDGSAANGCESALLTDSAHCGSCASACPAANHGTYACANGQCGSLRCAFGYSDCNNNPADGCEASLLEVANCGACGVTCQAPSHATAGCLSGVCGIGQCDSGYGDCNKSPADGCELSLSVDLNNCGGCNVRCAPANAVGSCLGGQCGISSCTAGHYDCNQSATDGCESQLTDRLNCGACGKVCPVANHSQATCTNATCGTTCLSGFQDCNGLPADGCEVDLSSPQSCGSCGNVCPPVPNATPGCAGGFCGVGTCTAGYGDCDFNAANGCEKQLTNDPLNCGMCGAACTAPQASTACLGGTCGILKCDVGYTDCDGTFVNGCEANTVNDVHNCGACGNACAAGMVCLSSACTCGQCNIAHAVTTCPNNVCAFASCYSGYGDCNNNTADGCEVDLNNDSSNCGSCGKACAGGLICSQGQCAPRPKCPNIMIVLDASGSEASPLPDNVVELTAEKNAVSNVLGLYGNSAPWGLTLLAGDAADACGSAVKVPVALGNTQAVLTASAAAMANGSSPVVEALRTAAADLSLHDPTHENVILLITDGGFNCDVSDPATVVQSIAAQSPSIKTIVVGVAVTALDPGGIAKLDDMARSGGYPQSGCAGGPGSPCYYPGDVSTTITKSVQTAVERLLLVSNGAAQCTP